MEGNDTFSCGAGCDAVVDDCRTPSPRMLRSRLNADDTKSVADKASDGACSLLPAGVSVSLSFGRGRFPPPVCPPVCDAIKRDGLLFGRFRRALFVSVSALLSLIKNDVVTAGRAQKAAWAASTARI